MRDERTPKDVCGEKVSVFRRCFIVLFFEGSSWRSREPALNLLLLCAFNIMDLPKENTSYKLKEYWDTRFSKEETFEWCKSYGNFKDLLCKHVRKSDRILMLGCGNSMLSEDMYNDGYRNIVNIDFSSIVMNNMKRKCQRLVDMDWIVMDITNMSFAPCSFDVVVEKATLDALLVEEKDVWNPSEGTRNTMDCVLSQVRGYKS